MTLEDKLLEAHRFWISVKGDEVVDSQQMFPNCKVRYTKCCSDDKDFWEQYQKRLKEIKHKKQSVKPIPPEGFKGW